ncbi:MAG: GGDEF domain-containing protein [Bdellovibrionales bacterium]|nr:GGDEF domain-containing protein [Bdellovibrionales bacterium]
MLAFIALLLASEGYPQNDGDSSGPDTSEATESADLLSPQPWSLIEKPGSGAMNPFSGMKPRMRLDLLMSLSPDKALAILQQHYAYEQALEQAVQTDALTQLHNRRAFDQRVSTPPTQDLYVVTMDIDHFSRINNTYGHPTGDVVIRGIAQGIRDGLRATDVAFRTGGEEFVILLNLADYGKVHEIVERIHSQIKSLRFRPTTGGDEFSVTISIGVAKYTVGDSKNPGPTLAEVIEQSDSALYKAKVTRDTIVWDASCQDYLLL